ncbi:MAG: hypothetical protein EOM62_11680 [Bacteroidia bacterium]|nr:hypothetical protein [Bacteroidia bacterium]
MIKQITIVIAVRTDKTIESESMLEDLGILGDILVKVAPISFGDLAVHLFIISEDKCVMLENAKGEDQKPCWKMIKRFDSSVEASIFEKNEAAILEKNVLTGCMSIFFLDEQFLYCGAQHHRLAPWLSLFRPGAISLAELSSYMGKEGCFWLSWDGKALGEIATCFGEIFKSKISEISLDGHRNKS